MTTLSSRPPSASTKTFTITTTKDRPLSAPTQLLFTITTVDPDDEDALKSVTVFAWEVLAFAAKTGEEKKVTWQPSRTLGLYNSQTKKIVQGTGRFTADIKPGNYVELDTRQNWALHPFFDGDDDKIIAINNHSADQEFVLGTTDAARREFQPFYMLRKLKTREGLAAKIGNYYMQIFEVEGYSRHQRIIETEHLTDGLLSLETNVKTLNLNELPELNEWWLYEDTDGGAVLENKRRADIPPPPPPISPTVDLIPLRDALQRALTLLNEQIPKKNYKWGTAVLENFGKPVMPILESFTNDSVKWEGYDV